MVAHETPGDRAQTTLLRREADENCVSVTAGCPASKFQLLVEQLPKLFLFVIAKNQFPPCHTRNHMVIIGAAGTGLANLECTGLSHPGKTKATLQSSQVDILIICMAPSFCPRGMAAWIEAWCGCSPGCGVEVDRGGREDAPCHGVGAHWAKAPEGLQAQVAELLVGIVWAVTRS